MNGEERERYRKAACRKSGGTTDMTSTVHPTLDEEAAFVQVSIYVTQAEADAELTFQPEDRTPQSQREGDHLSGVGIQTAADAFPKRP